jgi:Xaa-Pro aminopeptidase
MLTAEGCAARRDRLWRGLPSRCDALILTDPKSLISLANYAPSPFVFRSDGAAAVLILEPGRSTLVADNLLQPFVKQAHVDAIEAPVWYEGKRSAPHRGSLLVQAALGVLARVPGMRIGIEPASLPAGLVQGLHAARGGLVLVDLGPTVRALRRAKDPDELGLLRRTMRAGELAHAAILKKAAPGMTEMEAYQLVHGVAQEDVGEQVLVYGDFLSGPRCELVGGPPTHRRIARYDLLLLDFSVVLWGYRGDFANTWVVGGEPSAEQRRLFDACLQALAAGEALLRPGTPARAVDAAVRAGFAAQGLADGFTTHSGHGIGLGHPEPPFLVPESDDVLMAGDVVTLEPGQYVAGVGGLRYERNYLITADGFETLSHHDLTLEP